MDHAARSWHLLVRIGIATLAVAAALQLPIEIQVPGEPFLLHFIVVVMWAICLGRMPGFFAAAETSAACVLYFEPIYALKLTHAVDLLTTGAFAVIAAASIEAFCRLTDRALTERLGAQSARSQCKEVQARVADIVTSSADAIVSKTLEAYRLALE